MSYFIALGLRILKWGETFLWVDFDQSCGYFLGTGQNKMELLQSQAPVDWELSGSPASARHGTFDDIGH